MPAKGRSRHKPILLFGRNFLKHPRMLGSVIPSSRFLIDKVLAPVDWNRARVLVEFGPGWAPSPTTSSSGCTRRPGSS